MLTLPPNSDPASLSFEIVPPYLLPGDVTIMVGIAVLGIKG